MRKEKRWNYERTIEKEFRYDGTVRVVERLRVRLEKIEFDAGFI